MGYDIVCQWSFSLRKSQLITLSQSNYRDIHPPYGTMKDVDRLIQELKLRNMKLIMDLVVNHTSNQVKINTYSLAPRPHQIN